MKYIPDLILFSLLFQFIIKKEIKENSSKKAVIVLLFLYFAALYFLTLAPFRPLKVLISGVELRVNCHPYRDLAYGYGPAFIESLLNIFLFIPFGILGMLYRPKTILKQTIHGLLLSLSIETLQILSFTRASDITDLINNSLGSLIGAILLVLCKEIWDKQRKRSSIEKTS